MLLAQRLLARQVPEVVLQRTPAPASPPLVIFSHLELLMSRPDRARICEPLKLIFDGGKSAPIAKPPDLKLRKAERGRLE